jgi:hypothetical protein
VLKFYFSIIISVRSLYEKREGSGSRAGYGPLTNGSGSGRPKNMRILGIPNTEERSISANKIGEKN